jgi:hypothetical protein
LRKPKLAAAGPQEAPTSDRRFVETVAFVPTALFEEDVDTKTLDLRLVESKQPTLTFVKVAIPDR